MSGLLLEDVCLQKYSFTFRFTSPAAGEIEYLVIGLGTPTVTLDGNLVKEGISACASSLHNYIERELEVIRRYGSGVHMRFSGVAEDLVVTLDAGDDYAVRLDQRDRSSGKIEATFLV